MNGFMKKAVSAVCLAGALTGAQGCHRYNELVDPCWPQRYNHMARESVNQTFGTQANNGHVLDQTIWNYHFEPGSDRLTPGGLDHLAYLARRRPHPDPMVYLQTAQDVSYDAAEPAKLPEARTALDGKRVKAIRTYLDAYTSGRGLTFDVTVHDPSEVGMAAARQATSITAMHAASRGTIQTGAGGGGGAAAGGGGGGGGGGR